MAKVKDAFAGKKANIGYVVAGYPNLKAITGAGGIISTVTNMLDANKDGNVVDDVMGLVGKFLGGKK